MDPYATENDDTLEVFKLHTKKIIEDYQRDFFFLNDRESKNTKIAPLHLRRVAVVGAGVSGLLVAMRLGERTPVDVYEASDRFGGRLYTYKFPGGGEWDYFDVGAMRFPNTSVMKPTYDLFKELQIPLLNYQMNASETWLCYNNIRVRRSDASGEDFGARESRGGTVPDKWVDIGVDTLMKNVYGRFLAKLREDFKTGYEELMKYDDHSTRSFMTFVKLMSWVDQKTGEVYPGKDLYPTSVVNWLETMTFSAGWFDGAFSETILELFAFAEGLPNTQWRCVRHGSEKVTDKMYEILTTAEPYKSNVKFYFNTSVASVDYMEGSGELGVTWNGKGHLPDTYTQVILAISPQSMRHLDLSTCMLDYGQRSSLLMLQPGPSIKVGMKFKRNWWGEPSQNITGGQSSTDRPVRTVVYPSHGGGQSTVLIASYCWTQDSRNLGSWMQGPGSVDEQRLKELILADLAAIHGIPLEQLREDYESMYAFDWSHNSKTMGAFAFFGPGQFSSLFQNLTRPAARGRLHFAGEAISTCHAWVAGAVESANRVINQIKPKGLLVQKPSGRSEEEEAGPLDTMFESDEELLQLAISAYLQEKEFGTK